MERIQPSKGHSPTGECRQMDKSGVSGHGKNTTKQGALTNWRVQTDGQVRTWKKSVLSKGHSQTGEHRWMDKSGHRKNTTKQGALTDWRVQSADRQTSQDMEIIQMSKGHSLSEEHRQMDKSGHGKNTTE